MWCTSRLQHHRFDKQTILWAGGCCTGKVNKCPHAALDGGGVLYQFDSSSADDTGGAKAISNSIPPVHLYRTNYNNKTGRRRERGTSTNAFVSAPIFIAWYVAHKQVSYQKLYYFIIAVRRCSVPLLLLHLCTDYTECPSLLC